jgi:antitoxin (DNA-binding transcriptional repressor) of toxin-antitoxin stability system
MEKASVSKLKNNLSAYLRKVRAGQPVVIYDRDVPVARIERIETHGRGFDRLASLHAQGSVRPPLRSASASALRAILSRPLDRSVKLAEAVQEDRQEDR